MSDIILGIDPSTVSTGWAVICDGKLVDYGVLGLKGHMIDRIGEFYGFMNVKAVEYGVNVLAIETPFAGRNVGTFGKLCNLRGILYLLAWMNDFPLYEFAPSDVKKEIAGKGNASKVDVSDAVHKLYELPALKDDITDAIAIAHTCVLRYSMDKKKA